MVLADGKLTYMQPNRFNDFGPSFTIYAWCLCGHHAPIKPPRDNPTIPEIKRSWFAENSAQPLIVVLVLYIPLPVSLLMGDKIIQHLFET